MATSRRRMIGGAVAMVGVAAVAAPEEARAGVDDDVNKIVGDQNKIYLDHQPPHLYDYSAPRDVILQLYDAVVPRMANTWTVFLLPGVGPIGVTPSKGYPIPYGSQVTSPEYAKRLGQNDDGSVALPQPEPDGLYRSGATDATWVMAINDDGYVIPEYHEEPVCCFPYEVTIDPTTRTIVRTGMASASVTIDLSRAAN